MFKGLGLPSDPLVMGLIMNFNISRIGTDGMGFNWEFGTWGDTPLWIVEAFLVIDAEYREHAKAQ